MYISLPVDIILKAIENKIDRTEKHAKEVAQMINDYDAKHDQLVKEYNNKPFLAKLFSRRPVHQSNERDPWLILEYNQLISELSVISRGIRELESRQKLFSAKLFSDKEVLITDEEAEDLDIHLVSQ